MTWTVPICLLCVAVLSPAERVTTQADETTVLARHGGRHATEFLLYRALRINNPAGMNDPTVRQGTILDYFLYPRLLKEVRPEIDEDALRRARFTANLWAEQAVAETVWQQMLEELPEIQDADVREAYDQTRASYFHPEIVSIKHVFARAATDGTPVEEPKRRIDEAYASLEAGVPFDAVVQLYSDVSGDKTRSQEYFLPELGEAFRKALDGLGPGQHSTPFQTPYGWEIILLVQRRPEGYHAVEEVADRIRRDILRPQQENDAAQAFHEQIAAMVPEEANYSLLGENACPSDAVVVRVGERVYTLHECRHIIAEASRAGLLDAQDAQAGERLIRRLASHSRLTQYARKTGRMGHARIREASEAAEFVAMWPLVRDAYARQTWEEPGEEALKAYYSEHIEEFSSAPQVSGHVVLFGTSADLALSPPERHLHLEQVLAQAWHVREEIGAGRLSIEEAARSYSALPSGADGGLLPLAPSHGPHFDTHTAALGPGEISEPVPLNDGYALFAVRERAPSTPKPFEAVRDHVLEAMYSEHRERVIQEQRRGLLAEVEWIE